MPPRRSRTHEDEEGFLLIFVIVAIFLVLLTLSIAAPRLAMQIKRDREQETRQRAAQYTRAIQLYYRKNKNYPASIEQLKKSNNVRFLRQEYVDPMTGQKDWKLIHVGENKTQVKGFFGEDLPGIAGASGLTSAASGGLSQNSSSGVTTNSSSGFTPTTTSLSGGSSTSSGSSGGNGVASQSATTFGGSGGGAFMGVGIPKDGEALLTVDEQTNYQDWEFLYDPRIEALKAKASLIGGISSGSATSSNGLSTLGNTSSPNASSTPTTTPTTPTTPP